MINFKICRKCDHCTYNDPKLDNDTGEIVVAPSIICNFLDFDMLMMNDEPPQNCPYLLDHLMSMEDAPPEMVDKLSGKRKQRV